MQSNKNHEDQTNDKQSPSNLTVNEKPTPKPRPSRKRMGFYTTLCTDMPNGEIKSDDENYNSGKKEGKKQKKSRRLHGSKYYAALANEIANMNIDMGQVELDKQEEREIRRKKCSNKKETAPEEDLEKKENVEEQVQKVEQGLSGMSLSDEEPPKWFNKVVLQVSLYKFRNNMFAICNISHLELN